MHFPIFTDATRMTHFQEQTNLFHILNLPAVLLIWLYNFGFDKLQRYNFTATFRRNAQSYFSRLRNYVPVEAGMMKVVDAAHVLSSLRCLTVLNGLDHGDGANTLLAIVGEMCDSEE